MTEKTILDVEIGTIIKILLVLAAFYFIYILADVLLIVFLAILVASAVTPFAKALHRWGVPWLLSVLLIYFIFFGVLAVIISLIVPIIVQEINQVIVSLPQVINRFSDVLQAANEEGRQLNFMVELEKALTSISRSLQVSSGSFFDLLTNIFGGLISFVAVVVISFYFALMEDGVAGFFRSVLPSRYEEYIISLWKRVEYKIGRWIQGQLFLALVVGLIVYMALLFVGVRYALLLALLAMVFELIPIAGPVIAAIPALFFAYVQSPSLALIVGFIYIGIQQLENHVLAPVIIGRRVGLHPVTVIIALLIGVKLAGILGILLAVPVAVIVVEVLEDLARHREQIRVAKAQEGLSEA